MMIAINAAHNAMVASPVLPSKLTMFLMVIATVVFISDITSTPIKLNTADISIAARGAILRVDTHVAIALGASVHPLTKITPSVNSTVTNSIG